MIAKYFKPTSLTWISGAAVLLAGVVVALFDGFGILASLAAFVDALTGSVEPSVLIAYGLTAIGLRGAV